MGKKGKGIDGWGGREGGRSLGRWRRRERVYVVGEEGRGESR